MYTYIYVCVCVCIIQAWKDKNVSSIKKDLGFVSIKYSLFCQKMSKRFRPSRQQLYNRGKYVYEFACMSTSSVTGTEMSHWKVMMKIPTEEGIRHEVFATLLVRSCSSHKPMHSRIQDICMSSFFKWLPMNF
jgi:hypothetical protein